jgi:hypothetical protein
MNVLRTVHTDAGLHPGDFKPERGMTVQNGIWGRRRRDDTTISRRRSDLFFVAYRKAQFKESVTASFPSSKFNG